MPRAALPNRIAADSALLIIDLVSDFKFEDGGVLFERSKPLVERLAVLKKQFYENGSPVIFVNDELENVTGTLPHRLELLRRRSDKADYVLSRLRPDERSHWITKPQRSGFFATGLGSLLLSLNSSSVTVTGLTTDICVLFTAHDAYMRGYSVSVPADGCAAVKDSYHDDALEFLSRVAEADTRPLHELRIFSEGTEMTFNASRAVSTLLPGLSALSQ